MGDLPLPFISNPVDFVSLMSARGLLTLEQPWTSIWIWCWNVCDCVCNCLCYFRLYSRSLHWTFPSGLLCWKYHSRSSSLTNCWNSLQEILPMVVIHLCSLIPC